MTHRQKMREAALRYRATGSLPYLVTAVAWRLRANGSSRRSAEWAASQLVPACCRPNQKTHENQKALRNAV